jgi:murein tripeptide amidase MpaA
MNISSNFDGGNIQVISKNSLNDIRLKIRKDTHSDFFQWFYFRLQGAEGYPCRMKILNASGSFVPEGWKDYNAVASYDRKNWFRVPASYDGEVLTIEHTPEYNSVFYAYFVPYSYEKHLDLIHSSQLSPLCVAESIGKTVQGRDIDLLTIGYPGKDKKKIWIIARQHPGETMASWFMEGLLKRLLDTSDAVSVKVLQKAVFYLVPNVNVDGSISGNIRVNAAGMNLNREWARPDKEKSPEVYFILKKMDETGVDLNLDIHGDEELPYNFASSIDGIPGFNKKLAELQHNFLSSWEEINPDFQTEYGYEKDEPGKANLNICSKQIAQRFRCLSLTIEMPFKDNHDIPNPHTGWSPERSARLGGSVVSVIRAVGDELQ